MICKVFIRWCEPLCYASVACTMFLSHRSTRSDSSQLRNKGGEGGMSTKEASLSTSFHNDMSVTIRDLGSPSYYPDYYVIIILLLGVVMVMPLQMISISNTITSSSDSVLPAGIMFALFLVCILWLWALM